MATQFTLPRQPKIGDRIEVIGISETKLPINIVGNPESDKSVTIIFADQTFTGVADGQTIIMTISEPNILYGLRCVSVKDSHVWIVEDTALIARIKALESRIQALEG